MLWKRLTQLTAMMAGQNLSPARVAAIQQQFYTTKKQQQQPQPQQQQEEQKQLLLKALLEQAEAIASEVEWLTEEFRMAKVENNELLKKYEEALAESENMYGRLSKHIDDAKVFGIQSICKDLIAVADILGLAQQAVPKDKLDGNAELKSLYEGLQLTGASLQQVFKRHGLEPLDPINQKFDSNLHEALFQTVDPSVEDNTVVQVTKLGYRLHERCIRRALVGVSKR